jgi:hypothetical protein
VNDNRLYVRKAIRRIPLHAFAYAGPVGTLSFVLWATGHSHYLVIPGVLGVLAAFGKELLENLTITQIWPEFWIDSLAQTAGTVLGLLAMKLVV